MADRNLTDEDIEAMGKVFQKAFIATLTDPDTSEQIMNVWEGWMDKKIGKGVRNIAFTLIMILLAIGAMKFNLFAKLASTLTE